MLDQLRQGFRQMAPRKNSSQVQQLRKMIAELKGLLDYAEVVAGDLKAAGWPEDHQLDRMAAIANQLPLSDGTLAPLAIADSRDKQPAESPLNDSTVLSAH